MPIAPFSLSISCLARLRSGVSINSTRRFVAMALCVHALHPIKSTTLCLFLESKCTERSIPASQSPIKFDVLTKILPTPAGCSQKALPLTLIRSLWRRRR